MRIFTRIVLGLTLMGLLVVVGCAYTLSAIDRMSQAVDRVVEQEIPALSRLDRFEALLNGVHLLETQLLSRSHPDAERRELMLRLHRMKELALHMAPVGSGGPSQEQLDDFKRKALDVVEAERSIIAAEEAGDSFEARQLATDAVDVRVAALAKANDLLGAYRTFIEEKEVQNLNELDKMRANLRAYAVLSVLVTVLLMTSGIRSVLVPLRHLVRVARRIGGGSSSDRAESARPDEFGELGRTFNSMVDSLQQRLEEVARMNIILQDADQEHRRQLSLALNVQKSIVPRHVDIEGLDVFSRIHAARTIGGDFYDIHVLEDGDRPVVGLALGDASGNGIAAALVMVLAITLLREYARQTTDPALVLERVNRGILEQFPNELIETFVTATYVVVDPAAGRLRYAAAGNEPAILRRRDGRLEALEAVGMFLGTFEDTQYHSVEIPLEVGDKVIMFSDGLTESRAPNGEFLGRERIEALIAAFGHESVRELGERLLRAVQDFSQEPTPRDDVALLVVEITGGRK